MLDAMIYKPYGCFVDVCVHIYKSVDRIMIECGKSAVNLDSELHNGETFRDLCAKLGLLKPCLQIVTRNETKANIEVTISYSRLNRGILYTTFASHIVENFRSICIESKFHIVNDVTSLDIKSGRVFRAANSDVAVQQGPSVCYLSKIVESFVENVGVVFVSVTGSTISLTYRW